MKPACHGNGKGFRHEKVFLCWVVLLDVVGCSKGVLVIVLETRSRLVCTRALFVASEVDSCSVENIGLGTGLGNCRHSPNIVSTSRPSYAAVTRVPGAPPSRPAPRRLPHIQKEDILIGLSPMKPRDLDRLTDLDRFGWTDGMTH